MKKSNKSLVDRRNDFSAKVRNATGEDYQFLDEFTAMKNKMRIRHNVCGGEYTVYPQSFLEGIGRCRDCEAERKRLNREKRLISYIKDSASGYMLVGEYSQDRKAALFKHLICGETFKKKPYNFMKGQRCPYCGSNKIDTHNKFIEEIKRKTNDEFRVIGEWVDSFSPIGLEHVCGNVITRCPHHFIRRDIVCRECNPLRSHFLVSQDEFEQKVFDIVGSEYVVSGEYKKAIEKVEFTHTYCGRSFPMTPNNFLRGQRCPMCQRVRNKEELTHVVKILCRDEYRVLGDYVSAHTKIKFIHQECGNEFDMTSNNFLNGQRCPACASSKGEKSIKEHLDKIGIEYKRELRIPECRHKKPLPFDFAVFENNSLSLLIEYDGEQHFIPSRHEGGEDTLKMVRFRDDIKNEYCFNNDIPLLRIPYWDFENIEYILFDKLVELGLLEELTQVG